MITCFDIANFFGQKLYDSQFAIFLSNNFNNLTRYDIIDSDFISSEGNGIEFGFTNNTAIIERNENILLKEGIPIFTHFNVFEISEKSVMLPFNLSFADKRRIVLHKMGTPYNTNNRDKLSKKYNYVEDIYVEDKIIIIFNYNKLKQAIIHIGFLDFETYKHLLLKP